VFGWIRNRRLRPKSTLQTAIGIKHPRIIQKAMGFMGGSFNTREFFHGRSGAVLRSIKWVFLLAAVPAFDETLTTGEDTDFAFRAKQAGCEVVALPSLRVTHLGEPATLRQYYRQQLWHANRKAYATILKSTGGKSGANAIFFSISFLMGLVLAAAGLVLAFWLSPWALLLLASLALHLWRLGERSFHHDESIHAHGAWALLTAASYH
jgi:hypothetical protein